MITPLRHSDNVAIFDFYRLFLHFSKKHWRVVITKLHSARVRKEQRTNKKTEMSKYTITHCCGHTQEHKLYGKIADRERKAEWLATQVCTECWLKEQQKARDKKDAGIDVAFDKLHINNLPSLEGTPKQVAWAEKIRKQVIISFEKCSYRLLNESIFVPLSDCIFLHIVRLERSAKWYIETYRDEEGDHTRCVSMLERHFESYISAIKPYIDNLPEDEKTAPIKRDFFAVRHLSPKDFIPTWVYSGLFFAMTRLAMHATTSTQELTAVDEGTAKTEWEKIAVNVQNVKKDGDNALLINLPHNSVFDGFSVWIGKKLIREGEHGWQMHISVKPDMEFVLKKYGKGKWNKFTAIEEKKISSAELAEAFGGYVDED